MCAIFNPITSIFTEFIHQQHSVSMIECSVDDYSKYLSANVDYDFVKASIETGSVQIR